MQAIPEYLLTVPEGKVVTYGQITKWMRNPGLARLVVNHQGNLTGRFAFGGINVQRERLESEGIEVSDDYIVDLEIYQWDELG